MNSVQSVCRAGRPGTMYTWGVLLLLPTLLLHTPSVQGNKREFRIAWMAPKQEYNKFSAATTVNALKLALYSIGRKYLRGHPIRVKWYDSDCNSKAALTSAVDAKNMFDPHLFLGPPCSAGMRPVAQLASHWNIPVFGWVSNDHDLRDRDIYSTLIRLLGPLNQFSTTMRYVSSVFNWKRYAMIHDKDESYKSVYEALAGDTTNFFTSTHSVTPSMDDDQIKEIFLQVKKYARIIIFAVPWLTMRKYILVAHRLGLTTGEFAFICINGDVYSGETLEADVLSDRVWRRNDSFDEEAKFAFESVIHVILVGQEQQTYKKFKNHVQKMNTLTDELWDIPQGSDQLDAYAPFLYDATLLWAILVNRSMVAGENPTNGTHMFSMAQGVQTTGVTANLVLDSFCDRLVNIWLLDMQEDGNFTTITKIYNTLTGGMVFSQMEKKISARWPDGKVGQENAPPDIPKCGFEGEKCKIEPDSHDLGYADTITGAAAGSSVVLIIAIAVQVSLRRYRRRRQLESMLWQVKFEEIDFVTAILCGSVRSSFKNLARRRSSKNVKGVSKTRNVGSSGDSYTDSPRSHHCTETGTTMFGSVAYIRGSLVSVKRMSKNIVSLTKEVLQELNQLMELKNQNVCAFVGACVDPGRILLLWEYCPKGSLQDIIWNTNIKLDQLFKFALCQDVAKGLEYIHKSSVNYHGNLKSSNCVVDSRWTCKLTDFGVPKIRSMDKASIPFEENADKELWTAPEILRAERNVEFQKADIYAVGIIMKEVFTRSGPYTEYPFYCSSEIVTKVREPSTQSRFRPSVARELRQHPDLAALIEDCWSEDPSARPSAPRVVKSLTRINPSKHMTMIDNMIAMLEKYANHLEELVAERTSELDAEKRKTENLLYRMLPQSVAEDLKLGKPVKAEMFDQATIYFSDIVGFTKICGESTPIEVVNLLNCLYTLFDDIITRYDVYKVETIGDAYMIASGLPMRNGDNHIKEIADCAMDILASTATFTIPHLPDRPLKIRIGIHTGSVVAGVVGLAMPRYCLFGDTVNVASRMESTGFPLKIHLSSVAHDKLVSRFAGYHFYDRGEIPVKGKGTMNTFFLTGRDGFTKVLPPADQDVPGSPTVKFPMLTSIPDYGTHTREGSHAALLPSLAYCETHMRTERHPALKPMPIVTSTPCRDVSRDVEDSGYLGNNTPRSHVTSDSEECSTIATVPGKCLKLHPHELFGSASRVNNLTEPVCPALNRVTSENYEPANIALHGNRLSEQTRCHVMTSATGEEPSVDCHVDMAAEPTRGTNICRVTSGLHEQSDFSTHVNRLTEPTHPTHINRVTSDPRELSNSIVAHVNRAYEHDHDKDSIVRFTKNSLIRSATIPRCNASRPSVLVPNGTPRKDFNFRDDNRNRRVTRILEITPL
ncbi:atrial natriuretic peptide receptor 2-like isoform X1 [Haliotis rufescens]|uniref:atrial natriuretic peptide receptor 2-like isoform X1 n=2 Tax=Haliotis rufescens TaxID=6454 RepID=UPI00201F27A8|nr:atrial natriuretic peptide receptor 2-like isoform X1 [Haliotis rufescens]